MNEFFTNAPEEFTNKNADLSDLARNKWNSLYLALPKDIGFPKFMAVSGTWHKKTTGF